MFSLKMERISVFLWCSLLLVLPILADSAEEAFDFINRARSELKLPVDNPNIILVLGLNDTTSLVHFLAGDGNESGTKSRTLMPEMAIDEAGNVWYGLPGFEDNSNETTKLATKILMKTVIESASRLKIVIVVNYDSLTHYYVRGGDLDRLLTHADQLITDIDRYKNSVALVVYKMPSGKYNEDPADLVKMDVSSYLRYYQTDTDPSLRKKKLTNAVRVKTFTGGLTKIAIVWPRQHGRFGIPTAVEIRQAIRKTILEDISYTKIQPNDFEFPLSDTARDYIAEMAHFTVRNVSTTLTNIDRREPNALQQRIQLLSYILASNA